ncbi:hypothetical protein Pan44_27330 [Caulifigura coniformis]|uniref:Uncharacterized protein n=1 Tax=Caulifigura coniformis TaxID=2527983 RepID=A0A517SF14_9PLAN|nr:hypothetical protein [Caulifigura coniformis]QDT54698.1 hypothetical protein Pan44_27330 [Caulifigura coniformis]
MDAPERKSRDTRFRLWVLLTIAIVVYEIAIYWRWREFVPLRPSSRLALAADQSALGFSGAGELVIAHRETSARGSLSDLHRGPVEFREFPSGRLIAERLTPNDLVSVDRQQTTMYQESEEGVPNYDFLPWDAGPRPQHPTRNSPERVAEYRFLDNRRAFYHAGATLHRYDMETDRLTGTMRDVQSIPLVDGEVAMITKASIDSSGIRRRTTPALVNFHDHSVVEGIAPSEAFELIDISPDGQWLAFLTFESIEVWSVASRSRVWKKSFSELGVRSAKFSQDGLFLLNRGLDQSGQLRSTRIRTADGKVVDQDDDIEPPHERLSPPLAMLGDRYALFQNVRARERRQPVLIRWASRLGIRLQLEDGAPVPRTALLFDAEHGKRVGLVDFADARFFAVPDGSGFALSRSSHGSPGRTVEFYALPPSSDWLWLALRGVAPLLCLAFLWGRPRLFGRMHRTTDRSAQESTGAGR